MIGGFNSWSDFQEGPIPVGICDSAKAGFIFQPRQGRPLFLAAVEARFFRAVKFFMSVRLLPLHWRVVPGLTFRQLCRFSISDTVDLLTAFKNRTGFGFP